MTGLAVPFELNRTTASPPIAGDNAISLRVRAGTPFKRADCQEVLPLVQIA
jgi:hypothetical protein